MTALLPVGAVLLFAGAVVGYDQALKWLFRKKKQALDEFWNISPQKLTTADHKPSWGLTLCYPATEHAKRVQDLEVQSALHYTPFSTTRSEIRLLRLKRASRYDDCIQCTLMNNVDLGTNISYTALSYCWGDTMNQPVIVVDGYQVKVTQNLRDALKELRADKVEFVWVDALCINQRDQVEVQQQVQKMTLIYSRAESVFAWLGPEDPDSVGLRRTFERLGRFRREVSPQGKILAQTSVLRDLLQIWLQDLGFRDRQGVVKLGGITLTNLSSSLQRLASDLSDEDRALRAEQSAFLKQLRSVVSRDYWRRAWVLQELTVGGVIRLRCGRHSLDFELLSTIMQELEALHDSKIFKDFTLHHEHVYNLVLLRTKWQPREPIHFLAALRGSYHTCSTKRRDKIYSLFGVCFDSTRFVTQIDYQIPLATIIRQMTENSIRATRTLDVICVQPPERIYELSLPSWAPDWRLIGKYSFNNRMVDYLTGLDEHQKDNPKDKYWHATSNSRCHDAPFVDGGRVLKVRGLLIDTIINCSGAIEEGAVSNPLPPAFKVVRRGALSRFINGDDARDKAEDIFTTLTVYKPRTRTDDVNSDFSDLWSSKILDKLGKEEPLVYQWLVKHRKWMIHGKPLIWWSYGTRSRLDVSNRLLDKAARFLYHAASDNGFSLDKRIRILTGAVVRALKDGLRFMETSRGFTGWAHPAARVGDQISLLQGCSMPVILRSAGKQSSRRLAYEVVGDAYVENLMHGEGWPGTDEDWEEIYLQ
jgi:hypothetical protein